MLFFTSSILFCGTFKSDFSNRPTDDSAYYSDYFVFISDDKSAPVIIPLDFNWNPTQNGYQTEFKSWYGTKKDWPITYTEKSINSTALEIPKESFEHVNQDGFQFDAEKMEIKIKIPFSPQVTLTIPNKESWVLAPAKSEIHKETYASKTTIQVGKKVKTGWILYERIRWKKNEVVQFGDFETFYWIPLIVDGNLYHFEQHKAEKLAFKWSPNSEGKIEVVPVDDFVIEVTKTIKDNQSGRKKIPKNLKITSEKNYLNISLESKGEQVGYGKEYPKGLAYYRQSILLPEKKSAIQGHGMLELIIENN